MYSNWVLRAVMSHCDDNSKHEVMQTGTLNAAQCWAAQVFCFSQTMRAFATCYSILLSTRTEQDENGTQGETVLPLLL